MTTQQSRDAEGIVWNLDGEGCRIARVTIDNDPARPDLERKATSRRKGA